MEKEIIKLFIYYVMTIEKECSQDYSINGCIKWIRIALNMIKEESIERWNQEIKKFPENHPVRIINEKMVGLTQEQYKQILINASELMKRYSKEGTLNYDSLYLIASDKDVERLANQIIFKSKSTSEIKEIINNGMAQKQDADLEELATVMNELCLRYYYGEDIEKNYNEAIELWKTISDYISDAKLMLGICYRDGKGVEQNKEKAYEIFNEMSEQDFRAKYQIAIMNYNGFGISQNYEKALDIFSQLKGNSPYDMEKCIDGYMGEMYFYGLGTQQNKEKGLAMMENAWKSGIGLDYEKIKRVLKDYYSSNSI